MYSTACLTIIVTIYNTLYKRYFIVHNFVLLQSHDMKGYLVAVFAKVENSGKLKIVFNRVRRKSLHISYVFCIEIFQIVALRQEFFVVLANDLSKIRGASANCDLRFNCLL